MTFKSRVWFAVATLCFCLTASLSFSHSAIAQIDSEVVGQEDKIFESEIWPITNTGFNPSKVADAAMWYSMGSKWTLEEASENVPQSLKAQLESFSWINERWDFEVSHCYAEGSAFRQDVFAAKFDLETVSQYRSSPIVLRASQKSFSKKRPKDCPSFKDREDFRALLGDFQISWTARNPGVYDSLNLSFVLPDGEAARLKYKLDDPYSALYQTNWQWDLKDERLPEKCGLLRISPLGDAATSCCNGLYFQLKETQSGWDSITGGGTQVGCDSLYTDVDDAFYKAMPEGMRLNDDGTLMIGNSPETRIALDPVDRFESAYGQWILSGLEMRTSNTIIPTRPNVQAVTSRDKLIDLDIRLELNSDELKLTSACASASAPIAERKGMFLRLGKAERAPKGNCFDPADILTRLSRNFSQVIGDGAALLVEVDEDSGDITLSRMKPSSNSRSAHWIFSKAK